MVTRLFRRFVFAGLTAVLALPAPAQTARIAHLSHGGSPETLNDASALDNFGIIPPYFAVDSVRLLTDTTALEYGHWEGPRAPQKAGTIKKKVQYATGQHAGNRATARTNYLRGLRPAKLVGDTLPAASKVVPAPPVKPKRKKAALTTTVPAPAPRPGVALAVAAILVCAGAGWLLGERRPQPA